MADFHLLLLIAFHLLLIVDGQLDQVDGKVKQILIIIPHHLFTTCFRGTQHRHLITKRWRNHRQKRSDSFAGVPNSRSSHHELLLGVERRRADAGQHHHRKSTSQYGTLWKVSNCSKSLERIDPRRGRWCIRLFAWDYLMCCVHRWRWRRKILANGRATSWQTPSTPVPRPKVPPPKFPSFKWASPVSYEIFNVFSSLIVPFLLI